MRPNRQPDFQPDDDRAPEPLPAGRLDPPRRDPPTAIGLATPRQPSHPLRPTRYGRGLTRMQRIARNALGALLIGSGGVLAWASWIGVATVAGAGVAGVGVFVIYRASRAR
jgi:hypothetical protein